MVLKLVNSEYQTNYYTTYPQVKTTSELSTVIGEALVCNNNVNTPVGVGNSGGIEVVKKSNR